MALYPQTTTNLALWPEPIEIGYQLLGGGDGSALAPKLNHLGIADLLFMSSIMLLPRDRRPGASQPGWQMSLLFPAPPCTACPSE